MFDLFYDVVVLKCRSTYQTDVKAFLLSKFSNSQIHLKSPAFKFNVLCQSPFKAVCYATLIQGVQGISSKIFLNHLLTLLHHNQLWDSRGFNHYFLLSSGILLHDVGVCQKFSTLHVDIFWNKHYAFLLNDHFLLDYHTVAK